MFAYCLNNPVNNLDATGCRCLAATTIDIKDAETGTRDVTEEILNALHIHASFAHISKISSFVNRVNEYGCMGIFQSTFDNYAQFYNLVNHGAPWDIKLEKRWIETIGTPYPGQGAEVVFNESVMTPEMLGNFTYGYLGFHYGFSIDILYAGSYYAAGRPILGEALSGEMWDWQYIENGYKYAKEE